MKKRATLGSGSHLHQAQRSGQTPTPVTWTRFAWLKEVRIGGKSCSELQGWHLAVEKSSENPWSEYTKRCKGAWTQPPNCKQKEENLKVFRPRMSSVVGDVSQRPTPACSWYYPGKHLVMRHSWHFQHRVLSTWFIPRPQKETMQSTTQNICNVNWRSHSLGKVKQDNTWQVPF